MTGNIVRARWIEAADTEARMRATGGARIGPAAAKGWWPDYTHSRADMNGWGTRRLAEHRAQTMEAMARSRAPADAISRLDEVVDWTARFIVNEDRRILLWGWASTVVAGKSFSGWCRAYGFQRRTMLSRIDVEFEKVAASLCKSGIFLRSPDAFTVRQYWPDWGIETPTLAEVVSDDDAAQSPAAWAAPDAKPTATGEAPDFAWARRQWERERKRRAALKMTEA